MLVLQYGLNTEYVLDKMEMYEVKSLLKYQHYKFKEEWEQTRLLAYITAQCNSTKKLKLDDIIKFPWEVEEKKKASAITNEELQRLKDKAQKMLANKLI